MQELENISQKSKTEKGHDKIVDKIELDKEKSMIK